MQDSASASFQSVLRLLVSPQVHFPLEAFPAEVTAKRFEARVLPAVRDEIRALAEGLPAHLTLVRLLTCSRSETVRSALRRFTRSDTKAVRFEADPVRSLTCVDERVFLHV